MSRHVVQVRLREVANIYGIYGQIQLFLPASHSLKERRRVINSVKTKLHTMFNLSVADISDDGVWQRAILGFALVSSNMKGLKGTLQAIDRHLGNYSDFEVVQFDYEYFPRL